MATGSVTEPVTRFVERLGRASIRAVEEFGFAVSLLGECIFWIFMGRRRGQPTRLAPVFEQMMEIGILAVPIVSVLGATIGAMLAIQGIDQLRNFGAETQVVLGISLGVTREFAPVITGVLVAGRSGSALAARLGTMRISQEIDALHVMGINPVRFLAVPALLGMLVMLPALTLWADCLALAGAGLYVSADLGMSMSAYFNQVFEILKVGDVMQGFNKSVLFAILITLVGVINGAMVEGGAEGVGRATTRSVVHSITAIVIADMVLAFLQTR